jgi:outer membrane protein assembly factor BamA
VASGNVPVVVEVGGDRFFLFQTEIVYPLNQQADLALFLDVGDSLFEDQSWGFETARVSAGVELRFHLPVFPVPLRLIYGWPIRKLERDRTSSFTFSIGKSF